MFRLLLIASLVFLTACTSLRPPENRAPVETREVVPGSAPASIPGDRPVVGPPLPPDFEPRGSAPSAAPPAPPTAALLTQLDAAMAAGEIDRAGALAERALRITPRDAQTWYTLANIQFQQHRYADAEGSAQRALSFAGDNAALVRRINTLLGTIQAAK
jgi:hypothetical protein